MCSIIRVNARCPKCFHSFLCLLVLQACCPECGEVYTEGEFCVVTQSLIFLNQSRVWGGGRSWTRTCCPVLEIPTPVFSFLYQQCKPEYKVPGLYVIDSIVRQSRHQFGTEKDVFAPRFSKNIIATFQHLYRCPSDDKVRPFNRFFHLV